MTSGVSAYRAGSVYVTQGETTVHGDLTQFIGNALAGAQFIGPDRITYAVQADATEPDSLSIWPPYEGTTVAAPAAISGGTGTAIGDMTGGGNLAGAFDGSTTQSASLGAAKATATSAYIGKDFSAAPKKISRAVVYGSSNQGYVSGANPSVTLELYAKTGSAPASATDGTLLASMTLTDTTNESAGRTLIVPDAYLATLWDHVWVRVSHNGSAAQINVAEVVFWSSAGAYILFRMTDRMAASALQTQRLKDYLDTRTDIHRGTADPHAELGGPNSIYYKFNMGGEFLAFYARGVDGWGPPLSPQLSPELEALADEIDGFADDALAAATAAAASATTAAGHVTTAAGHVTTASGHATAAATSAAAAATSETNAETQKTAAAASATAAAASATAAAGSATTATTQATNAAASATTASGHAGTATTKASDAATSAGAAAASAAAAAASATAADASADAAADSAADAAELVAEAEALNKITTTSTTTITPTTSGNMVFTVALPFHVVPGQIVRAISQSNLAVWATGVVQSLSGATLTITATQIGTATSKNDWAIGITGERGLPGSGAVDSVNGQTGPGVILGGADIAAGFTGVNYVGAPASSIADHLSGIDTAISPGVAVKTDIDSAATCDIGSLPTLVARIMNTTTITSLGSVPNVLRIVQFAGSLTLTHNASSLVLPGGTSIVTQSGDMAMFRSDGAGNWRCLQYLRASGIASGLAGVYVGTQAALAMAFGTPGAMVHGTGNNSSLALGRWAASTGAAALTLGHSRGAAVGTHTVVQSGDGLGSIVFDGSDGTDFRSGAAIVSEVDGTPGASDMPGRLIFKTTPDGSATLTERLRIDCTGLIKAADSGGIFAAMNAVSDPSSSSPRFKAGATASNPAWASMGSSTATRTHMAFENGNGVVGSITTNGSATAYATSSDYRLKENDEALAEAVDVGALIDALRPIRFTWKADGGEGFGFFAHELQEQIPEAVTGEKDGTFMTEEQVEVDRYQGVDMSKIVPYLVAEIQLLRTRIAALEAQ